MYARGAAQRRLGSTIKFLSEFARRPSKFYFLSTLRSAIPGQRFSVATMSISPPPTPPSRAVTDDEWRFETITLPCEWVEDYHPGGYHPVILGDVFNNGQYKVIRKLGEGSYSTVWLACDLK